MGWRGSSIDGMDGMDESLALKTAAVEGTYYLTVGQLGGRYSTMLSLNEPHIKYVCEQSHIK